jgi:hypothetical protein
MTAPTKEEAAAIRRWAEALWAAEKAMADAHALLNPVRDSCFREIRLADIRCWKLLLEVTNHRVEAERAKDAIEAIEVPR